MKNLVYLATIFFLSSTYVSGVSAQGINQAEVCLDHYPTGRPEVVSQEKAKLDRRGFWLCEDNYAVLFDPATKTPLWVAESLNGQEQANTFIDRADSFKKNPRVASGAQASLDDYRGSGMDRGHMAPAANMLTERAMEQSFFLTNIVPQVGQNMNRTIWADLEGLARKWSTKRGQIVVFTGPIFSPDSPTVGKSKVLVPSHLYKIAFDMRTSEAIAFIVPNQQIVTRKTKTLDAGNPNLPQSLPEYAINCSKLCVLDDFIVSVQDIENKTGISFFPKITNRSSLATKSRMWPAR